MNSFLPRTCAAIAATVALSTAATTIPQAAHAFSFSVAPAGVTSQPTWNGDPTTVIDFSGVSEGNITDSPPPLATSVDNGNANIARVTGDSVYTDNSPLFTGGGQYLSVGTNCTGPGTCGGLNLNGGGSVRLSFDAPKGLGYFGLFWASPSVNDRITFTLRNAIGAISTVVYNASDIFGSSTEGRYVNFFSTNNGDNANKVIASVLLEDLNPTSEGQGGQFRSFEVDNIAYQAIPTPALLPGLVALGAGLARKKKAQAEAKA